MKYVRHLAFVFFTLLVSAPAFAQWQVPDHSVPVGRGGGSTGFKFAAPGTAGLPLISNGASSDPSFQALDLGGAGATGNLPVARLNNGTNATSSTFWRGDGQWVAPAGIGTVTTAGNGLTLSGGGSILGITAPVSTANGGTGVVSPAANTIPVNQGASPQTNLALTPGQCVVGNAVGTPIAAAGCRVLLNTLTASNSSVLQDTTSFTSAYKFYEIEYINLVPVTNASQLMLQIQSGGSYKTTGYQARLDLATSAGVAANNTGTSGIFIGGVSMGNFDPGASGYFKIYNPSANHITSIVGAGTQIWTTGVAATYTTGGFWATAGVVTGFQVFVSSGGNISSGQINVYGYN